VAGVSEIRRSFRAQAEPPTCVLPLRARLGSPRLATPGFCSFFSAPAAPGICIFPGLLLPRRACVVLPRPHPCQACEP
jgi:hypothetical protein